MLLLLGFYLCCLVDFVVEQGCRRVIYLYTKMKLEQNNIRYFNVFLKSFVFQKSFNVFISTINNENIIFI